MLYAICENAKGERFDPGQSIIPRLAIDHDAGQRWHLGDPATVVLLLDLDAKLGSVHDKSVASAGAR